jgi:5-carboxymethyl-2-hydroxymuconate isomerase
MPHIIAEYSANLEDRLDVQALVSDLHQAAIDSAVAEIVGIRSRAVRREHFRVADGHPANGFVHTARLRRGRTPELRKALGAALLAAADKRLQGVYPTHPIGLTVEVHEIDPDMTFRRNTLRERAKSAA